jgi:hypothetical protein
MEGRPHFLEEEWRRRAFRWHVRQAAEGAVEQRAMCRERKMGLRPAVVEIRRQSDRYK